MDATGGAAPVIRCRRQPYAFRHPPHRVHHRLSSIPGTGKNGAKQAPLPVHWQHNTHTHLRRFRCGDRGMPQSHRGYQAEWHRSHISLAWVPRWSCTMMVPYLTELHRRSPRKRTFFSRTWQPMAAAGCALEDAEVLQEYCAEMNPRG